MKVAAEGIVVQVLGKSAQIELIQTFEQGKFRDQGPKEIVVIGDQSGLRIAREEMLRSTVGAPSVVGVGPMPVIQVGGQSYIVIAQESLPTADGRFEGLGAGEGYSHSGRRKVADAGPYASWTTRTVHGYPGGAACTIDGLYEVSVGTVHFGVEQMWSGDHDGDGQPEQPALSDVERDEQGSTQKMLGGHIAECDAVLALPAQGIEWVEVSDSELADRATAMLRKHAAYQGLQREFESYEGNTGPWEASGSGIAAAVFAAPDGKRLVVVGASAGHGCGDFEANLYVVFMADGDKLTDVGRTKAIPAAVVLADPNDLPILAGKYWMTVPSSQRYDATTELDLGFNDCPC
jgi:hypothetical protein